VRHAVLIGALGLALASARVAAAAPSDAGVKVEVAEACTGVDRAQLTRLLNVEQRRDTDAGVERARVSVACEGDVVTLRVEERGDVSLPRVRTLKAAEVVGDVGARVLALSAIEMLNDRSAAPQPEPPAKREPRVETRPDYTVVPPRLVIPPSVRLMAQLGVRSFDAQRPLVGYGLSVDYLRLAHLGVRLDFDVALAERHYDEGSAHVQLMTLSAQVGVFELHDTWSLRGFVGYRLGSGRITGESAAGLGAPAGTVAGPCGGPMAALGYGLRYGILMFDLGAEAGLVSFPLEGRIEGHDSISLKRYWLGASISLGVLL
jgi:hypothetical protein